MNLPQCLGGTPCDLKGAWKVACPQPECPRQASPAPSRVPPAGLTCLPFSLLAGGVGGRGRLVGLPRRQDCRASSSLLRRTQAFHGRLFYFLTISVAISSSVASVFLHIIRCFHLGEQKGWEVVSPAGLPPPASSPDAPLAGRAPSCRWFVGGLSSWQAFSCSHLMFIVLLLRSMFRGLL